MATAAKSAPHHHLSRGTGTHGQSAAVPRTGLFYTLDAVSTPTGVSAVSSTRKREKKSSKSSHHTAATTSHTSEPEAAQPGTSATSHHGDASLELESSDDRRHPDVISHGASNHNPKTKHGNSVTNDASSLSNVSRHVVSDVTPQKDFSDSSNGGSDDSSFQPPPLPPVPWEMAEAIKRQQKGAGAVRYWRSRHLQTAGGGQPLSLKSGPGGNGNSGGGGSGGSKWLGDGGIPSSLLPSLGYYFDHDHGNVNNNGVGRETQNGGGCNNYSRSKLTDRWHPRGLRRENVLAPSRTTLYGGSLGHHPPLSASYKRSVTALDCLVNPLFSLNAPPPQPPSIHHNYNHHPQLQQQTPPGSLTTSLRGGSGEALPGVGGQAQGEGEVKDSSKVSDLTVMQLADTILGTKTGDLSRLHQLCQSKIRYVDYLERSADATENLAAKPKTTTEETTERKVLPKPVLPQGLGTGTHNWIPRTAGKMTPNNNNSDGVKREGAGEGAAREMPTVSLPSLPGARLRLSALSTRPGSTVDTHTFWSPGASLSSSTTTGDAPASGDRLLYIPPAPTGKPILKPPSHDPLFDVRCHDPFSLPPASPRADGKQEGSRLAVRGKTLYPFGPEGSLVRETSCPPATPRRTHSSKDMRRRAVRFSVSDQVREYKPSEPLFP